MLAMVRSLDPSEGSGQRFLDEFATLWHKGTAGALQAITVRDILGALMFWSYVGGLICVLVFGILNLPF
jgi:hypothetical protein